MKNCHFSKKVNSWFWSKNGHFFSFPFLGNIGQKNVFYNILERKKAFLGFKNEKFKKLKIGIFTKRLTHGFGPKMAVLQLFFLGKIGKGKCLLRHSRTKKCLSRLKNKKFKKSKNCHFSKRVNPWFLDKNDLFGNFFFF